MKITGIKNDLQNKVKLVQLLVNISDPPLMSKI